MATNAELESLFGDGDMINKVQGSLAKVASEVLKGDDTAAPYDQTAGAHDKRVSWVASALTRPGKAAIDVWILVLGANASATVAQITSATDATIDSNVKDVIDGLAVAYDRNTGA